MKLSREELLFQLALTKPEVERASLLDRECVDDPALRQRLQALLAGKGENQETAPLNAGVSGRQIEGDNPGLTPTLLDETPVTEGPGTVIGRYKLLEQIGEGGFGVVYVAEQREPVKRQVALKIIKLGMDTRQIVARFEAERQALALMDHPNIAKVFDAGATVSPHPASGHPLPSDGRGAGGEGLTTHYGRPYFVMELVKGVPITQYCDREKLSTQDRLSLFIAVCQAIQHAHQKGVIHRDIKPSNILVAVQEGKPLPKVIDFGIAKATQQKLTEKTLHTQLQQFIGTPAYMSPEQAEMSGSDIDTRSDIYSLGVLLYELLVGKTPFDTQELLAAGLDEIRRTIREKEPVRPSTRLTQMRATQPRGAGDSALRTPHSAVDSDLDWIVMKCLEKDRTRRYDTANGLAMDLQRHLDNEPVLARPPSTAYRLQKAWRRNKLVFTAAAVVVGALVVGIGVSSWQAVEASRARNAERQQRLAAQTERDKSRAAQREAELAREAEKAIRVEAEHQLYAAKMNLAQQAWDQNNIGRLRQLLDETQDSPYRGYEWYYWQTQTHRSLRTLRGHLDEVASAAFSPDGQRIVTASYDHTAKVWDTASGRELFSLRGHDGQVRSATFSPDGRRIVTASHDRTAKVWEAGSGRELLTLKGHDNGISSVAFSPDSQRIVTGSYDRTAKVWGAASGHELLTLRGHDGGVISVAFSPDGHRIATGGDIGATVWEAATGKELFPLDWHGKGVLSVGFSPDGQRIVTGSDSGATVWDAATGKELFPLKGHSLGVLSAAYSLDGQRIVTGSADNTAKVWEAATGRELFTLKGHNVGLCSAAFSPDGQRILTGSHDRTAKVWDVSKGASADRTGRNVLTLTGHTSDVFSVAFSPDSRWIVTGSADDAAKVWEAASGKEVLTLKGHRDGVFSVAFSPDGQWILTGGGGNPWPGHEDHTNHTAKVWEAATGRELLALRGHSDGIISVAFSPDGQRIVTGSYDNTAKVWEATTGKVMVTLNGHLSWVTAAAFSPDGQRIVTGSGDNTAKVWEAATGRELLTLSGHDDKVRSAAFSPDGQRIVTGSWDHTAKVWEAASGRELLTFKGHSDWVWSATFSPDGQRIVSSSDDGTAKVWEAASGLELLTLNGHSDGVDAVAFSPDGQQIATASADNTAKVWGAATPRQVVAWKAEEAAVARPVKRTKVTLDPGAKDRP